MSSGQCVVKSSWHSGLRCNVAMGEFDITVDEPESVGGTNCGPMPTDLFLASIASCFTLAVAYSARQQSIELRSLSVTVTGTYDGPCFRSINIDSRVGCDTADVAPLVRAAERVCYVTNSIRSDVEINVEASASLV